MQAYYQYKFREPLTLVAATILTTTNGLAPQLFTQYEMLFVGSVFNYILFSICMCLCPTIKL